MTELETKLENFTEKLLKLDLRQDQIEAVLEATDTLMVSLLKQRDELTEINEDNIIVVNTGD